MKNIWQLFKTGLTGGAAAAAVLAGFAGFLYLLYRLIALTRPKAARQEEQRVLSHRFYRISGRGRAAYLILCLEEALRCYSQDLTAWEWILRKLWSIADCSESGWMDLWLDSIGDLLPSMVLSNNAAETASDETIKARTLYTQAGSAMIVINAILENTYAMVSAWSPDTSAHDPDALRLIDETEETMRSFGIPLPADETIQPLLAQKDASFGAPFDRLRHFNETTNRRL